jgi:hypothetical protein
MTPREVAQALRQQLTTRGVVVGAAVQTTEIEAFERRHAVRLTAEARDFFSVMNGMLDDAMDPSTKLRLWRLEEVCSAVDEFGDAYRGCYMFADYLLWSHAFAARLDAHEHASSEIILVGGEEPVIVATSLTVFLSDVMREEGGTTEGVRGPF